MSLKSIAQYISYILLRFFILLFVLIPFPVLYLKAKFLKLLLHKVLGYRKKVVRENLQNSFPEKNKNELKQIESEFYDNLAMITLESFKGFYMSKKQFAKRYVLKDSGGMEHYLDQGMDIVLLGGHVSNWEWWHGVFNKPFEYKTVALYKPLTNKYLDKYLKKDRAKYKSKLLSIYETSEFFKNHKQDAYIYLLAADQSPSNTKRSYVANFFHRKTYFLHGPERYSRMLNIPVYYAHMRRVRKGYYEAEFELISDNVNELPDGEIINRYAALLEQDIRKRPGDWLWSHRRWKHKVL